MGQSRRGKVKEVFNKATSEGRKYLLESEAKEVCYLYDIPVVKTIVARSKEEAVKIANEMGYPVVLKILSPDILHKSDVGGVKVNLKSAGEVAKAYDEIMESVRKAKPDARIIGVTVQEMAPEGLEVIIGGIKDEFFGHAVMFGLGGIFVEILKDVAFGIVPLTRRDDEEMIREIKSYPVLEGARGLPPRDINALVDTILKVSTLLQENPEIKEMDLNPTRVYEKGKGVKVLDARIILE